MSIDISEKEQIDMIKNWWRENGKFTLFSIVAALVLSMGWRYWQNSKNEDAAKASLLYEQMLSHESNHQYSQTEYDVTSLLTFHPKTPYASLAAFISAQNAVNVKNFDEAIQKLDWVIDKSKNQDFTQIAKIRKARILLSMNKYEQALKAIEVTDVEAYLPVINEIKGDILSAKGEKKEAHLAYQSALNTLSKDAPNRQMVQMKYEQS
jgi:predicted negative regulator of RcsB-dependent stress response